MAYKEAIVMCYGRQIEALVNWILLAQTWVIVEAICDVISPFMTTCVVNQSWVLVIVKCPSFCNQIVCEAIQGDIEVTSGN